MQPCSLCQLISSESFHCLVPNTPLPQKYYLQCSQGHIICQACKQFSRKQEYCRIEGKTHKMLEKSIECLKMKREGQFYKLLKNASYSLKLKNQTNQQELKKLQKSGNQQLQQRSEINQTEYNLQLQLNQLLISSMTQKAQKSQTQKIKDEIQILSTKISKFQRQNFIFWIIFDLFISLVAFVGFILENIEVMSYLRDGFVIGLFILYWILLSCFQLTFLKVIFEQIWQKYSKIPLKAIILMGISIPLLPITVAFSIPAINIKKNKKIRCKQILILFPNKFLCNITFNYTYFIMKTLMYWMIIVNKRKPFRYIHEEITFTWSFIESAALVYLNLRYNVLVKQ